MDTIQAAALRVKLQYLDSWNSSRRRLAAIYAALLSDLDIVQPVLAPYAEHVYHLYVMRVRERDALRAFLAEQGIETGIHYPIPMMFGLKLRGMHVLEYLWENIPKNSDIMSEKQRPKIFTLGIIALLLGSELALAQTASEQLVRDQLAIVRPRLDRGETVTNRSRPELDPLGMRAGSFLIYPRLGLQETYNDNIFAAESDEQDDFITLIRPQLDVRSDWTNHAVDLRAGATIGRHADETDEDFNDFSVGASGRLDITGRSNLRGDVSYNQLHEGRGSPDDVRRQGGSPPVEPTVFKVGSAFLTYTQWLGRFLVELDGAADRLDYDDVRREDGGIINNDDRDRTLVAGGSKLVCLATSFARK